MEVEYELTPDDLYAFQWRAAFKSPIARRVGRKVYPYWLLALLLVAVLPAIGPDGFVISRANFTFLLVALPAVVLAQWHLERRLMRRAILQLLKEEKPGKGQLGSHRVVLSEDRVVERTGAEAGRAQDRRSVPGACWVSAPSPLVALGVRVTMVLTAYRHTALPPYRFNRTFRAPSPR